MRSDYLKRLWASATKMDSTLRIRSKDLPRLLEKHIDPIPYSRGRMFHRMMRGRVSLFSGVPIRIDGNGRRGSKELLLDSIRHGFERGTRARVQVGPERRRSAISIGKLLDLWEENQTPVSTTDLHFRDSRFQARLRAEVLSDFNLLCAESRNMMPLEMMTLVIGSAGNVTDSHSDDSDGSNHSFVGKKLWIAWDRREGAAGGLQDVTHDVVWARADFTMRDFLSLSSSCWWTVSSGRTLFLPGNMTHKVLTLEPYIGFGSFHVSLPAYFRTITRWILHEKTDVNETVLHDINAIAIRQVRRLQHATSRIKQTWGFHLLPTAYRLWAQQQIADKERVLEHPVFLSFMSAASRSGLALTPYRSARSAR